MKRTPPRGSVEIHRLSNEQAIRRFVELPKLFELLLGERSFFPSIGTLRAIDPFECAVPLPKGLRGKTRSALKSEASFLFQYVSEAYQSGDRVEDYKRQDKLLRQLTIAQLRQHVSEMRLMLLKSRIVCNCWHLSDCESDAMWKLYGNGSGVMIVSTVKRLRAAIKHSYSKVVCDPDPQEYLIAPVHYIDETDTSRVPDFYSERPWLLKRSSFAYEREIRVSHQLPWMMIGYENGGMTINLDPRKLISEVILSPFIPAWADRPLATAIEIVSQQRGIHFPIRRSSHMTPPEPKSQVLASLEFLKMRDGLRGRRLRLEPLPDYRSLAAAVKPDTSVRKRSRTNSEK